MADWKIRFIHDAANDVIEAKFENVVLATMADVVRWRDEVDALFKAQGRKVDLLIDLDGLDVRPAIAATFGAERSRVLSRYTLRSFRYNGNRATRTTIFTSSVLHHTAANIYESRDAALAALLEDRRKGGGK